MYDIFYVSNDNLIEQEWQKIKSRFPSAQSISNVTSFDQIRSKAFTKMFWVIWDDLEISKDFDLLGYRATKWDDMYIHVFLNGNHYDGICLFSKNVYVSNKEFSHRFFTNKKEVSVIASQPKFKQYDIIFISYTEPNAEENFQKLLKRFPFAKRVHGVKGIHNAHLEAARLATTEMFWVVDADAEIAEDFNFDYIPWYCEKDAVHVWSSVNPVNNLVYGYGGVKLLPTNLTLKMNLESTDMTTSISSRFKKMNAVSNITAFNTDPFNTWKSAFRECVKLSSRTISRQDEKETTDRLQVWTTVGNDSLYGSYSISGARAGAEYGTKHKTDPSALRMINDFSWLEEEFKKYHG